MGMRCLIYRLSLTRSATRCYGKIILKFDWELRIYFGFPEDCQARKEVEEIVASLREEKKKVTYAKPAFRMGSRLVAHGLAS
ncbi:hypothetical protein E2562_032251 [Oryza meyeriana var. granulata]|uniref:Uncharacterized protein n=1 Tax=Oryza meyeriana var. granulata TaxID=110450 RepID=A0A6G1DBW4_9ORYZ|nr:hypothetical protein E2562_032251 [Oryza meyeriana var. granulata]